MLSASLAYGMRVPAFPQKTFLAWPGCAQQPERAVTSTATLEVLGARGHVCDKASTALPIHPWGIIRQVRCAGSGGGGIIRARGRARLRLTIGQVCVRRRLARFPRLLRGKQATRRRRRSGGAEGRR